MSEEKKVIEGEVKESSSNEKKENKKEEGGSCSPKKGCPMQKLKKAWAKETKEEKRFLTLAVIAFVATFLPWSTGFGYFSYSMNAWNGFGFVTGLSSLSILLLFALPVFGVKVPKVFETKELERKALSIGVLFSPALWLLQSLSYLRFLGIGLWITLAVGAYMVYLQFNGKK